MSASNQSLPEVFNQDTDIVRSPSVRSSPSCPSVETSPSCFAGEVRQVIREEMSGFRDELAQICTTIANFNRRSEAIEARLTALEERFSDGTGREDNRLAILEERLSTITMKGENEHLSSVVTHLQNQLNDREQEYFLNDVEISGFHETNGENLIHITTLIGKKLGVEIEERDIVSAERLGPRHAVAEGEGRGRPRIVTVKFTRRALRDQLLRGARVRRNADTSEIIDGTPRRFYINERLTRANRQLFYKTKEIGRQKGFQYIWTSNGRIFIRRESNAPAYRIRSDNDIEKFF